MARSTAEELTRLGEQAFSDGDVERAVYLFSKAIEHDSDLVRAWYERGMAYGELGKRVQSFGDLSRAVELDPYHAQARHFRALAASILEEFETAAEDWDILVEQEPDNSATWVGRARHRLFDERNTRGAMEDGFTALRLDSQDDDAYVCIGEALAIDGRFEAAAKIVDKGLSLCSDSDDLRFLKGRVCYYQREYEEAVECLRASVELEREYDQLFYARALTRIERYADALAALHLIAENYGSHGGWCALHCECELALKGNGAGLDKLESAYTSFGFAAEGGMADSIYDFAWLHALRAQLTERHGLAEYDPVKDREKASHLLREAIALDSTELAYAKSSPVFDSFWARPELAGYALK